MQQQRKIVGTGKQSIYFDVKQKSISIDKLLTLSHEYWQHLWDNPAWKKEDTYVVLDFLRFLEKKLEPKKK